jgi:transcriptional regulator with XRE-family HTH domain
MSMTEKLDLLMNERGINKSELAQQSGVPYMTIVNFYKVGTENVKRSTLLKLAKFFGVSLDYLADDEVTERTITPEIVGAAAHFDPGKLTPEAIEEYNRLVEYLAFKYKDEE